MDNFTKKLPVVYVDSFPTMISIQENLRFKVYASLATGIKIHSQDGEAIKMKLRRLYRVNNKGQVEKIPDAEVTSEGEATAELLLEEEDIKYPFEVELIAQDKQIPNPDYKPPVPDPDGPDGPETGDPGTPDLPPTISHTSDIDTVIILETLDESMEKVIYEMDIKVKVKTYNVPSAGLIKAPFIKNIFLPENNNQASRDFFQMFKLNKRQHTIKLNDVLATSLVTTQPTEGTDKQYHTLVYFGTTTNPIITLNASSTEFKINKAEGYAYFNILSRSPDNLTVKIPDTATEGATKDYAMPAADRTTTCYFNIEVSDWNVTLLFLEPTLLKTFKNEPIKFRVKNDIEQYSRIEYVVIPDTLGQIKNKSYEFWPSESGYGTIQATLYNKYDMPYDNASIKVFVEDIVNPNPIRIMMHNRKTNRLTTIKGNPKTMNDMIYAMSKESGKLITRDYIDKSSSVICKPRILYPKHMDWNANGKIITNNFEKQFEGRQVHVGTMWEFAEDQGFKNVLEYRQRLLGNGIKQDDLYECVTPLVNCKIWVRVKYLSSSEVWSDWSDPVQFTHTDHHSDVGGTNTTAGEGRDGWNGCFYGGINSQQQVVYNYRGNFQTLFDNNLKTFNDNMQVIYNGKKYTVKTPMTETTIKVPGTETDYWQEDNRNNLPTPKNLIEQIGIGVGLLDYNIDKLSFGHIGIGDVRRMEHYVSGSTEEFTPEEGSPGENYGYKHQDNEYRWLKFGYHGKILYVLNKPVCEKIAWNDIAKRYAHDGRRTIKLGNHLYRVRMLSEEEYFKLLHDVIGDWSDADLGINNGSNEWLLDLEVKSRKKIIHAENGYHVQNMEAGERAACYRPVLEWIRPGDEPYRCLPWSPIADLENLVYDPMTDTGYFGVVKKENLITYEQFCAQVGFTEGTLDGANDDTTVDSKWVKYYWHGHVLFVPISGIRNTFNPDILQPKGISYAVDGMWTFSNGKVDHKNVTYSVGQVLGCKWAMVSKKAPYSVTDDMGQYSMWNELLYRVYGRFCIGTNDISSYSNYSGGHQIGDNWTDLGMSMLNHGSGSMYVNCPEPDAITVKDQRYFIQRCGVTNTEPSLLHTWTLDSTNDTDDGYLPILLTPRHTYIDSEYFAPFKLLLPDPTTSTTPHFIYGDLPMNMSKEVIDQLLTYYQEKRKEADDLLTAWNNNNMNPRYVGKDWRAVYSPTPCQQRVVGPYEGIDQDKVWYFYLSSSNGITGDDNDSRWEIEEINHMIRDYCSYSFWGNEFYDDPGYLGYNTIDAGSVPRALWTNRTGDYMFPVYNRYEYAYNMMKVATDAINHINSFILGKEDKLDITDPVY